MKYILFLFVSLFSQYSFASLDYISASKDLDSLTKLFTQSLFEKKEKLVYDSYIHSSIKNILSLKQLEDIGEKYRATFGKFISMKKTQLSFSTAENGTFANATYLGTFEKATGDISIKTLHFEGKWHIIMFAITSPLLNSESKYNRKSSEYFVTNSDTLSTGEIGNLVTKTHDGRERIVISNVRVITARWKITDNRRKSGYVTFDLTEAEEKSIKQYKELSLRTIK